jgi:hypothetical protein
MLSATAHLDVKLMIMHSDWQCCKFHSNAVTSSNSSKTAGRQPLSGGCSPCQISVPGRVHPSQLGDKFGGGHVARWRAANRGSLFASYGCFLVWASANFRVPLGNPLDYGIRSILMGMDGKAPEMFRVWPSDRSKLPFRQLAWLLDTAMQKAN